jgi:iron complex outermembrane receptor protein
MFQYAGSASVFNIGAQEDIFYGRAVFQYRPVDHWRLPASFTPVSGNPQDAGNRLWSDSTDRKLTLIAGLSPLDGLDVWLSYVFQDANKGFSPPETEGDYQIWEWPLWERQSISLNASWELNTFSVDTSSVDTFSVDTFSVDTFSVDTIGWTPSSILTNTTTV